VARKRGVPPGVCTGCTSRGRLVCREPVTGPIAADGHRSVVSAKGAERLPSRLCEPGMLIVQGFPAPLSPAPAAKRVSPRRRGGQA